MPALALAILFAASSAQAQSAVERLRVQFEHGELEAAREGAMQIAEGDREWPSARTLLGEIELLFGDPAQADTHFARAIEHGVLRAELLSARARYAQGHTRQAEPTLRGIIERYNRGAIDRRDAESLTYVAVAAAMLNSPQEANRLFREATRIAPSRAETQLEWAGLFLDKGDTRNAEECVRDALAHDPERAEAHLLQARVLLANDADLPAIDDALERALRIHPNHPDAMAVRARLALRDMDLPAARRAIDAALVRAPNHLEALSLRAASEFSSGNTVAFEAATARVLSRNPEYVELFSTVAEAAEWQRRYSDVVRLLTRAVAMSPHNARVHATLGLTLLRLGEEERGLAALRESFRLDRFDARVLRTLDLWEDVLIPHYRSWSDGPFLFRAQSSEAALLEPLLGPTMRPRFEALRERYGMAPRSPIRVDLFQNRHDFSVRAAGLPNVHVAGVSFGRVIAALSPRSASLDWELVLTHELAHSFHLELSHGRVPRFFTEGLAEYEARQLRPEWVHRADGDLGRALQRGTLPSLVEFDRAFSRARTEADLDLAYHASTRAIAHLIDRFGWSVIPRLLQAFGRGLSFTEATRTVLGIDVAALDQSFRRAELERVLALDAVHPAALRELAAAARRRRDEAMERSLRQRLFTIDPHDRESLARWVDLSAAQGHWGDLLAQRGRIHALDPERAANRFALAQAALALSRSSIARMELEAAERAGYADPDELARALARLSVIEASGH